MRILISFRCGGGAALRPLALGLGLLAGGVDLQGQLPFQAGLTLDSNAVVLSWEAVPGGRYDVRSSSDPAQPWNSLLSAPLISPLNFVNLRQQQQAPQQFFQVLQLDNIAPLPWKLFPSDLAIGVSRHGVITVNLYDDGTLDTNTISLALTNGPPINLADARLELFDNVLTFTPGAAEVLGGFGQTITALVSGSDLAGNSLNNVSWSFQLEPPTVVKTNVLRVADAGLALLATNADAFTYAFTGDSSGLIPGTILVSEPPDLFYRRIVLSVSEDLANHEVTVQTTNASLADCVEQGSAQVTEDLSQQALQFASASAGGAHAFLPAAGQPCCGVELAGRVLMATADLTAGADRGRAEIRPRLALRGVFGPGGLQAMDLEVSAAMVLNLGLEATAASPGNYTNRIPLGSAHAVAPLQLGGRVPGQVDARLNLALVFESSWDRAGSVAVGLNTTNLVSVDAKLRSGQWKAEAGRVLRYAAPAVAWEAGLGAKVRVMLEAELVLDLDGIAGPFLTLQPAIEARGSGSAPPGRSGFDVLLYEGMTAALKVEANAWDPNVATLPSTNLLSLLSPVRHTNWADLGAPLVHPVANMVWIPGGHLAMGTTDEAAGGTCDCPVTEVTFSRGFYMGRHEVTQAEYLELMGSNPSVHAGGIWGTNFARPVEGITWEEAMRYCSLLTERERAARRLPIGYGYRLPTEAEWEYACRAGVATAFHTGPVLTPTAANFDCRQESNPCPTNPVVNFFAPGAPGQPQPVAVGLFAPNAWGLHDMHGNVSEWCLDWLGDQLPGGALVDPRGSTNGPLHFCRGGSFATASAACRWAERGRTLTNTPLSEIGFRIVLTTPPVEPISFTLTILPGVHVIANQLDHGDNRLSTLFGLLPEFATFNKWNGTGFDAILFDPDIGWLGDTTLAPGEGAFVNYSGSTPLVYTWLGVPRTTLVPPVLSGCQLLSRQTPEPGDYESIALRPPVEGAQVLQWQPGPGTYRTNTFHNGSWSPSVPTAAVGEAVFICVP